MQPIFSVVIPLYNCEKFFGAGYMIQSVLTQSYDNFELILVDDGSSDNTAPKCEQMAVSDTRVHFMRMDKNSGASAARNRGIDCARGKYVICMDADDFIDKDFLLEMGNFAEKTSVDTIVSNFSTDSGPRREAIPHPTNKILDREYIHEKILPGNIGICDSSFGIQGHWRIAYRKALRDLSGIRYDETKRKEEDHCYLTEIIGAAESMVILDSVFYHYIKRSGSLISKYSPRFSNLLDNLHKYKNLWGDEYDFECQAKLHYDIHMVAEDSIYFILAHEKEKNVDKKDEIMKILTNEEVISWYLKAEGLTGKSAAIKKMLAMGKTEKAYHYLNFAYGYRRIRHQGAILLRKWSLK